MIDVKRVARTARLNLSEAEVKKFERELSDILKIFSALEEADTKKVEPSFHVLELKNVTREDIVEKSLGQEDALKNSKHVEKGFFKGPKAV